MIEATATMAMMPMTTPRTVSSDRVLCWRRESNARRVLSPISSRGMETSWYSPRGFPPCEHRAGWGNLGFLACALFFAFYRARFITHTSRPSRFEAQGFDGIKFRSPVRRVQAKEQSHDGRYRQRQDHCKDRDL